jgi:hypothetical protein
MAERLYPYGYTNGIYGPAAGGGQHITLAQLKAKKSFYQLHPEVQRRLVALFDHCIDAGHPLGLGTGWRVQPTTGGTFVRPGYSYHQGFWWDGGQWRIPDGVHDTNALAIDTVPSVSWPYMNGICERYGFVHMGYFNDEFWHIQPLEIPRARRLSGDRMMLVPPPLNVFPLPDSDIDDVDPPKKRSRPMVYLIDETGAQWASDMQTVRWLYNPVAQQRYWDLIPISGWPQHKTQTTTLEISQAVWGAITGPTPPTKPWVAAA